MKKVTMSMIKSGLITGIGTTLTIAATAKVTNVVYEATEDYNLACSAGAGTAVAGITATATGVILQVDHDMKTWDAQDHVDCRKMTEGLHAVTEGLDVVSKAMKIASIFSR